LAIPSLDHVIDLGIGRTRHSIITDDDGGGKDAVVAQSGSIDLCNAFDSQHVVARSYRYVRVYSEWNEMAVAVEMSQLVKEESDRKESD